MKFVAVLKRSCYLLIASKWIALLLFSISGIFYTQFKVDPQPVETTGSQYDVLISSYIGSGSSLVGMLLGFRTDTFYFNEPFWKSSRCIYWNGTSTVCRSDRMECRKHEEERIVDDSFANNKYERPAISLAMAKKLLTKIYDCDFNHLQNLVVDDDITIELGGPSWSQVSKCIRENENKIPCINVYGSTVCKTKTHKVTKVLRLTVDIFEDILHEMPSVKLLHVFRDPRAVINSRIEGNWFHSWNTSHILINAKSLCAKMEHDLKAGHKLSSLFPERTKFLFYEDLQTHSLEKLLNLYSFLGMSTELKHFSDVKKLKMFHKSAKLSEQDRYAASWWRRTLDWDISKAIEVECDTVFKSLGYKRFRSELDMRDFNIPSVDIRTDYRIPT